MNRVTAVMQCRCFHHRRRPVARIGPGFLLLVATGCNERPPPIPSPTTVAPATADRPAFEFRPNPVVAGSGPAEDVAITFPRFSDVATAAGIDFTYENGASPKALMVESTGGGCAWLDFDRDERWDLYLPQGGAPDALDELARPPDYLYRNRGGARFEPAQIHARIDEHGYGQGVAVGDLDDDGFDDLYVTNVGGNRLYRNLGDGTFEDITSDAGVVVGLWSTSAAWGDLDGDLDLDLYVCNYTVYDPYHPFPCVDREGAPTICHPQRVEPEPDHCCENLGDGRFREVSRDWGLFGPGNKGLGVVIADLTDDGRADVFVANDTTANFLFVRQDAGGYRESAIMLGTAFGALGETMANMGVGLADYDGNGHPDLYITHFTSETNTLYQNLGAEGFRDASTLTGMRDLTLPKLGFGTVMGDLNADGHCDIVVANGHIDPRNTDGDGYEMSPQIFSYDGAKWRDGGAEAGPYFVRRCVGRGLASADFDRDGDLDLAVVHQNSPMALLRNDSEQGRWLIATFAGITSNRRGIGVKAVLRCGDQTLVQQLAGGTSYLVTHQPLLAFGLADSAAPCELELTWPSGRREIIPIASLNVAIEIREGRGWRLTHAEVSP